MHHFFKNFVLYLGWYIFLLLYQYLHRVFRFGYELVVANVGLAIFFLQQRHSEERINRFPYHLSSIYSDIISSTDKTNKHTFFSPKQKVVRQSTMVEYNTKINLIGECRNEVEVYARA